MTDMGLRQEFRFIDDELYVFTPSSCEKQLVMDKNTFQECYKRWILNETKCWGTGGVDKIVFPKSEDEECS